VTRAALGESLPVAINDAGWIVGDPIVLGPAGFGDEAVLWSPSGQATVRENLGGIGPSVQSQALAINASGWSVGFSYNQTGTQDAVLWSPSGKVTNLGAVLGSAWTDTEAVGINNRGDILDSGDYDGGHYGFLLAPVSASESAFTVTLQGVSHSHLEA
jgi:hypothetical protein